MIESIYDKRRREWEQSPEGQATIKRLRQERAAHEAFVYHHVPEALLALTEIVPVNLKSSQTTTPIVRSIENVRVRKV